MFTIIKAAGLTLVVWFGSLAILTLMIEPTANVIVFGASHATLEAPVALLDSRGGFVRVRGTQAGFVSALYGHGAWLVLPATNGGCRGRFIQGLMANRRT